MDVAAFLEKIVGSPDYRGEIAHCRYLPSREPRFGELSPPLPEPLRQALLSRGIQNLYIHQSEAVQASRNGENIVVVASTAGGKTLCYNLPVFETLLKDPNARALYLFPTKALAQDQLRGIRELASSQPGLERTLYADTYDGDTPKHRRKAIREGCRIVLTNPDMLHAGILPNHTRWGSFLSGLRYVIIDEIHTYRGVFGSHTACVLRRLKRLTALYRATPRFLTASATIANPLELAEELFGEEARLIENDGSPQGAKRFIFWNPSPVRRTESASIAGGARRSANLEAVKLLVALVIEKNQTIVFTRARVLAELICRYAREKLESMGHSDLVERVKPYRGGFLAEDRRKIEKELFEGQLLAVTSTIALELGIDVGTLEAAVLVGYPGTIAGTRQQAGRAGRSRGESLVVLVAHGDPIDQYLMRHPEFLFDQSPEHAVVDPENVYVLSHHLCCAAREFPLTGADSRYFGPLMEPLLQLLIEQELLHSFEGKTFWSSPEDPALRISLRSSTEEIFEIVTPEKNDAIGLVDGPSACLLVHPGAVYLHEGETFVVKSLDMEQRRATVVREEVDYFTLPQTSGHVRVTETRGEKTSSMAAAGLGDVTVTWRVGGYSKVRFYTSERIGTERLSLPDQQLETAALWIRPSLSLLEEVHHQGIIQVDALAGVRNVLLATLPMLAMCDRKDLGGTLDDRNFEVPTVFIYDRYAGGMGFSEKGFEMIRELIRTGFQIVSECPCPGGCPSCVGVSALSTNITQEPDEKGRLPSANKQGALLVLDLLRGL